MRSWAERQSFSGWACPYFFKTATLPFSFPCFPLQSSPIHPFQKLLAHVCRLGTSPSPFFVMDLRDSEVQEKESDSFKSLFKQGIVYLNKGGHSEEKRMLLVQGRKHHLIAHQVELSSSSMNR